MSTGLSRNHQLSQNSSVTQTAIYRHIPPTAVCERAREAGSLSAALSSPRREERQISRPTRIPGPFDTNSPISPRADGDAEPSSRKIKPRNAQTLVSRSHKHKRKLTFFPPSSVYYLFIYIYIYTYISITHKYRYIYLFTFQI